MEGLEILQVVHLAKFASMIRCIGMWRYLSCDGATTKFKMLASLFELELDIAIKYAGGQQFHRELGEWVSMPED